MAARTISVRLTLAEADTFRAGMRAAGADGAAALKNIIDASGQAGSALSDATGKVGGFGRAANDTGAAAASLGAKLDALRGQYQALAQASAQAAAAQGQKVANQYANFQAPNFKTQSDDYKQRAADLNAAFVAGDKLRASIVPLAAAQQAYAEQVARASAAEKAGIVTATEANEARARAVATLAEQRDAIESVTQAAAQANVAKGQSTANQFAGFQQPNFKTQAADYNQRSDDIGAAFADGDKLRASVVPLAAAEQAYEAAVARATNAEKLGVVSTTEAAAARVRATATFAAQKKAIDEATDAQNGSAKAGKLQSYQLIEISESAHKFGDAILSGGSAVKAFAYEVPNAIAIAGGFKNALAALASVSPYIAIAGTAAAIVGLAVAGASEESRLRTLGQQIRATRDDYTAYANTLETTARQVAAASTLGIKDAREAVNAIGQAPNFSGGPADIQRLTTDAQNLSVVMNVSLGDATKYVTAGLDDVSRAAHDLASKGFESLNPDVVRHIDLLQQAGKSSEAFSVYLQALEERSNGSAKAAVSNLSGALTNLYKGFDGSRESGRVLTQTIGQDISDAVAVGVNALANLLNKVDDFELRLRQAHARIAAEGNAQVAAGGTMYYDPETLQGYPVGSPPGKGQPMASTSTSTTGRDAFVTQYSADAQRIGQQLGTSAVNIMADWLMETGNGTNVHDFNVGNIHAGRGYQGATVTRGDTDANGNPYQTLFRAYPNQQAGADDYGGLLQRRYPAVVGTGTDAVAFGKALYDGGYMEDRAAPGKIAATAASLAKQYPGLGAATGYATGPGMVNDARVQSEALSKQVAGTRPIKADDLTATLAGIESQLQKMEVTGLQGTPEYRGLLQREQETRAAQYGNVGPQEQTTRSEQSSLRASAGATPADQAVNAELERRRQIALTTGDTFGPDQDRDARNDQSAKASQQLEQIGAAQIRAAASSTQMTQAFDKGKQAVVEQTAAQQALTTITPILSRNSAQYATELASLTDVYTLAAKRASELQTAQQNASSRDNLTIIQAETDSLGMNVDARTKMIAVMQAELAMHAKFGDVLPKEAQDYIALAGRTADASAALAKQTAAYQEIGSVVSSIAGDLTRSITTPFQSGETAAKRFESVATSVFSSVASEITKLAIVNPLTNAITGGNSPTINSVGGVLGKLLGGSLFGGSSASSAAAITSTAGSTGVGIDAGVGGLYHSGGIAGREPTSMRFYPASLWHGAPRYHTGGVAGNEVPAVLQAGEGVFTPGQMKALGSAAAGGQQQGGGPTQLHLHINAQGAGPREIDQLRNQMPGIALAAVQNASARGGKFANTVRGR